ncbi:hypothetical protein VSR01_28465 [Actinacidiphila sp. DG2A-62]|uniref:hypothetical protein n=1 Tax=Actinacidiphila sp. DG2A-62 TaxID=3108821 RepID=UPI002DB653EE|nr:hypothetical protein [Actinacidiphila sp. DG2A-62]MEC3997225.1 hypothetical protein [Actinacidiphila sp. DG2A-62]
MATSPIVPLTVTIRTRSDYAITDRLTLLAAAQTFALEQNLPVPVTLDSALRTLLTHIDDAELEEHPYDFGLVPFGSGLLAATRTAHPADDVKNPTGGATDDAPPGTHWLTLPSQPGTLTVVLERITPPPSQLPPTGDTVPHQRTAKSTNTDAPADNRWIVTNPETLLAAARSLAQLTGAPRPADIAAAMALLNSDGPDDISAHPERYGLHPTPHPTPAPAWPAWPFQPHPPRSYDNEARPHPETGSDPATG